jgi:predicted short-subunit dehydrogenase-like oxidoreductase (DUF2520 family)
MTSQLKAFQVVIIGTGNVATVLGQRLFNAGVSILQVVGRSAPSAKRLADQLQCSYSVNWHDIQPGAALYLLAIPDRAIHQLSELDVLNNALVAHTAGSISINILDKITSRPAIFYPLQSLRSGLTNAETAIPILVDAKNETDLAQLKSIASLISNQVQQANDADRMHLHVAAVVVNNFTNHLYREAKQFCNSKMVDFKLLQPLMEETVHRLRIYQPEEVQTGPAIRGDIDTIAHHQTLLQNQPDLLALYQLFSAQILAYYTATSKGK